MRTTFDQQRDFIISIFKQKSICENGVAQLELSKQVQQIITYFKDNHVFSLREGLISTEKLKEINLQDTFASEGCFFGINGNVEAKTDTVILVDCNIDVLGFNEKTKYVFLKNCKIHDVFIHSETGIFRLYDKVNIENLYIEKGNFIQSLRVTGSEIKRVWGNVRNIDFGNGGSIVNLYK